MARALVLGLGYGFLYAPLLFLVIFSFNQSRLPGVWSEASWVWYEELFADQRLIDGALTSFKIASCAATFSVMLGLLAGLSPKQKRFQTSSSLLLTMPDLVLALSLLLVFLMIDTFCPLFQGPSKLIIGHTTLSLPYTYLMIRARLQECNPFLEEAALNLGAKPFAVFLSVRLPLLVPTLIAAWMLAFALSFDDVVLASFLAGPQAMTLPLIVFSSVRLGISPKISALASLLIASLSFIFLVWTLWFFKRKKSTVS